MAKKEDAEKKTNTTRPWIIVGVVIVLGILWYVQSSKTSESAEAGAPAAIVNGEPISMLDLEKEYAQISPEMRLTYTKGMVLNDTIIQKLLLLDAQKKAIVVADAEIEETITALTEQFNITRESFFKELEARGVSEGDAKELFRKRMVVSKLYDQIVGNLSVSDEDAKKFYEARFDENEDLVRVSHILLKTKEEADALLKELKASKNIADDFAKLAKEKSIDTGSATFGGDLGFAAKGMFVPAFEEAAFKLNPGELSDVVQTEFGYHVILVTDKQKAKSLYPFEEVKEDIIAQLQQMKSEDIISSYIDALYKSAVITVNYKE